MERQAANKSCFPLFDVLHREKMWRNKEVLAYLIISEKKTLSNYLVWPAVFFLLCHYKLLLSFKWNSLVRFFLWFTFSKPHHVPASENSLFIMRTKPLQQCSTAVIQKDSHSQIIFLFQSWMSHTHTYITFIFITQRALQCVWREKKSLYSYGFSSVNQQKEERREGRM